MNKNLPYTRILAYFFATLVLFFFTSCTRGGTNPFAKDDAEVNKNVKNLMGLAVGMTKNQVFSIAGDAYYVECYEWGSA